MKDRFTCALKNINATNVCRISHNKYGKYMYSFVTNISSLDADYQFTLYSVFCSPCSNTVAGVRKSAKEYKYMVKLASAPGWSGSCAWRFSWLHWNTCCCMEDSNVECTDTSTISMGSSPTLRSVTLISALQHFNHQSCTISFPCD